MQRKTQRWLFKQNLVIQRPPTGVRRHDWNYVNLTGRVLARIWHKFYRATPIHKRRVNVFLRSLVPFRTKLFRVVELSNKGSNMLSSVCAAPSISPSSPFSLYQVLNEILLLVKQRRNKVIHAGVDSVAAYAAAPLCDLFRYCATFSHGIILLYCRYMKSIFLLSDSHPVHNQIPY